MAQMKEIVLNQVKEKEIVLDQLMVKMKRKRKRKDLVLE
jgi:hypothetical protein